MPRELVTEMQEKRRKLGRHSQSKKTQAEPMTDIVTQSAELRANVAAMIAEYLALGVRLTPHQIFHQLVARGLLEDTPADYDNLVKVLPNEHGGGMSAERDREQRLTDLKDVIAKAQDRLEHGEPNLIEDIEAILGSAFCEPAKA